MLGSVLQKLRKSNKVEKGGGEEMQCKEGRKKREKEISGDDC